MNGAETSEREEALRQSTRHNEGERRDAVDKMTAAVKRDLTLRGHIGEHPVPWLLYPFAEPRG